MAALPSIIALLFYAAGGFAQTPPDTLMRELRALGSFERAYRLAFNPQGGIYVADVSRNQIFLVKESDAAPMSVGGFGWEAAAFDRPTGLATDGLNLFVADHGNHRVQRFDRSLNFISSFTTRDSSVVATRFGYPLGVALSRLGDLFILDGENLRVLKFTPAMRFEQSFGDIDDHRARLSQPLKIAIGPNDHVYVLEPGRLLEFDYFGHYLRSIGEGVLREARSFCLSGEGSVIVTGGEIRWFDGRGEPGAVIRTRDLLTAGPLGLCEDVASTGDRLVLLTSTRLHIFEMITTGH